MLSSLQISSFPQTWWNYIIQNRIFQSFFETNKRILQHRIKRYSDWQSDWGSEGLLSLRIPHYLECAWRLKAVLVTRRGLAVGYLGLIFWSEEMDGTVEVVRRGCGEAFVDDSQWGSRLRWREDGSWRFV